MINQRFLVEEYFAFFKTSSYNITSLIRDEDFSPHMNIASLGREQIGAQNITQARFVCLVQVD